MQQSLEAIAFHEAGHAVVAIYFGLPFHEVSIVPSEDAEGHLTHPTIFAIDFGLADGPAARRRTARQQILGCYAGLAAQRLIEPEASADVAAADDDLAFELSCDFGVMFSNEGETR